MPKKQLKFKVKKNLFKEQISLLDLLAGIKLKSILRSKPKIYGIKYWRSIKIDKSNKPLKKTMIIKTKS